MNRSKALMNRRSLFQTVGAGMLLALAGPVGRVRALDRRLGLQLYTVRDRMARDFDATLRSVGAIGYDEVEFAGYFGRSAVQVGEATRAARLAPVSAHVDLGTLRERHDAVWEMAHAIGHRFVVVPALPARDRRSLDAYRAVAGELNRLGESCRDAGLRLAYHNHAFEFEPVAGQLPYDVLLESTDPELVAMELDLYWATLGGQDPRAYFERWPGRFPLWHVKDMGADRAMVDPGAGTIDFAAIFADADRAGLEHCFVEHDQPVDSLATARTGHVFLRDLEPGGDR